MNAEFLTSQTLSGMPGITHAFFTRRGGISKGIYQSLNVGVGSDDQIDIILENRSYCMLAMGAAPSDLVTVHQTHSSDVAMVEKPWESGEIPKADGMVTNKPRLVLGILTADCTPILFADVKAGVIGAAHAGWKGAVHGVADSTVIAMEKLGANRANITACIGPCIGQMSYEVGPEFPEPFLAQDQKNTSFFQASEKAGHHMFDIGGYNLYRLNQLGLNNVDWVKRDTCAEENTFYSYRRSTLRGEPDYGRQLSAIRLER